MKRRSRLDIKGARFPAQKNQDFPPHTRVCHGFHLLSAGLRVSMATASQYKLCVIKHASQDRSALSISLAGGRCENKSTPQDRSALSISLAGGRCENKTTPQDRSALSTILAGGRCENKSTPQDRSALSISLAGECREIKGLRSTMLCETKCSAGDSCETKEL
jgi:hypothetical protein